MGCLHGAAEEQAGRVKSGGRVYSGAKEAVSQTRDSTTEMCYLGRGGGRKGVVLKEKVRLAEREVMMKLAFVPGKHLCSSSGLSLSLLLGAGRAPGNTLTEKMGYAGYM